MTAQDAQSFLSMTYASVLVQVKRNFDKFMQLQLQSIQEAKIPKRSKCGLLCFVENFEEFAALIEGIFRKSERRTDLDKWYVKIVEAIFLGKLFIDLILLGLLILYKFVQLLINYHWSIQKPHHKLLKWKIIITCILSWHV